MAKYAEFYQNNGVRFLTHFVNPVVIDVTTLKFPENSTVHNFIVSTSNISVSKSDLWLNSSNDVTIRSIVQYKNSNIGTPKYIQSNIEKYLSRAILKDKKFVFKKIEDTSLDIKPDTLLIYDYGLLNSNYKYSSSTKDPEMFINTFSTLIHYLLNDYPEDKQEIKNRNKFVVIELPSELLPRMQFEELSSVDMRVAYKWLKRYNNGFILDIWKCLFPKHSSQSILYKIDKSKIESVNFIFKFGKKGVIVNFAILMASIIDYNLKLNIEARKDDKQTLSLESHEIVNKVNDLTMRKLTYILLYKIIYTEFTKQYKPAKTYASGIVEKDNVIKFKNFDTDKDNIIDVDKILREEIHTEKDYKGLEESVNKKTTSTLDKDDDDIIDLSDTDDDFSMIESLTNKLELNNHKEYEKLDDLYTELRNQKDELKSNIEKMKENKLITSKSANDMIKVLEDQAKVKNPYGNKDEVLKDILDLTKDDFTINEKDTTITDSVSVFDKSFNKNITGGIEKTYIQKQYQKDVIRCIYAIQNNGMIVLNHKIEYDESIMGKIEMHTVEYKTLSGNKGSFSINIPYLQQDGTFKLSTNEYRMRKQRTEYPIRRLSPTRVVLNSYYGKIFVDKALTKMYDKSAWFFKEATKLLQNDDNFTTLLSAEETIVDVDLPSQYAYIARCSDGFSFKDYEFYFGYNKRHKYLSEGDDLKKLENNKYILIGKKGNNLLFMDMSNFIYEYEKGTYKKLPDILTLLGLEEGNAPVEFCSIGLRGEPVPVVLVLSYNMGFNNLLKMLKVKYRTVGVRERPPMDPNKEYTVKFKDNKFIIERDFGVNDLIFAGLVSMEKQLKELPSKVLESQDGITTIMTALAYKRPVTVEVGLVNKLFLDPITESLLIANKEPSTFKGLLIKAIELMTKERYTHPNDVSGTLLKGYERIPGMLYNTLVTSIKEYENALAFSKVKFNVNPFAVINDINADSSTVIVDDLNPLAMLKQVDDTTYLGKGGRKEVSMNMQSRIQHKSEIGIISEGVKDSGSMGVTALLSANPNIKGTRGVLEEADLDKEGWAGILSSSALLMPFATHDDVKRTNFVQIQSAHIVPVIGARAPYIRTGYETIFPIKVGGKFVTIAEQNGKVLDVTKSEIKVQYEDKSVKSYKLYQWTSKEESGSCYTHNVVANLEKGDLFIKDDTLAYDELFFEQDIFNRRRVLYKQGSFCNVAIVEDQQTFEDSSAISKDLAEVLGTKVTKIKSFILDAKEHIIDFLPIGTEVETTTPLFSILSSYIGDNMAGVDKATRDIIKDIQKSSPVASYKGVISKVVCFYNEEPGNMSKSLRELVEATDARLKKATGFTGRVNSGYSVEGKKLMPGEVQIKVYIDVKEKMSMADKCIYGNQLKSTVGEVWQNDIVTEDGKTVVDAQFAYSKISARIVVSAFLAGTTASLLEKVQKDVVSKYFK